MARGLCLCLCSRQSREWDLQEGENTAALVKVIVVEEGVEEEGKHFVEVVNHVYSMSLDVRAVTLLCIPLSALVTASHHLGISNDVDVD